MQPTNHVVLFETVLRELVLREHMSMGMGCGLVRGLHMHKETSLALTDLRTAHWLCRNLKLGYAVVVWDEYHRTPEEIACDLYATCRVNLLDLLPKVRVPS